MQIIHIDGFCLLPVWLPLWLEMITDGLHKYLWPPYKNTLLVFLEKKKWIFFFFESLHFCDEGGIFFLFVMSWGIFFLFESAMGCPFLAFGGSSVWIYTRRTLGLSLYLNSRNSHNDLECSPEFCVASIADGFHMWFKATTGSNLVCPESLGGVVLRVRAIAGCLVLPFQRALCTCPSPQTLLSIVQKGPRVTFTSKVWVVCIILWVVPSECYGNE